MLTAHLWASGKDMPYEYLSLLLCRDVYHCTPSELRKQNMVEVQRHLTCISIEGKIAKMKAK